MASISTNISTMPRGLFNGIASVFRPILSGFEAIARANAQFAEFERLNAKSDEQLAKIGMTRADIPRHLMLGRF